ncbi:ABC transporter substrate-binding protein [Streptomyces sp. NPDC057257]|uniref:ABC transporter substrate-binding protein n=1 Tax=Streptomyces sp. NPDC057257 TaxID=3346071 RepID=UPI003637A960
MKTRTPYARAPRTSRAPHASRALAVAAVVLGSTLLASCDGNGSGSGSSDTVTVGLGGNIFDVPIRLADKGGYFAKQGLKVKYATVTASTGTSALQSGSVQFLNDSPTSFLSALAQGLPQTVISSDAGGNPLGLIVTTEFAKKHDLTADTPAAQVAKALVGSTGGASSTNTKAQTAVFLKSYGVGPDQVKWVSLPSPAADKAALKNHQIDWFTTSEPTPLQVQQSGDGVVVADETKVPVWSSAKVGYTQFIAASNSYLRQHAAVARKFVTAVQEATAYMHAHPGAATVQSAARQALLGVPADVVKSSMTLIDWPTSGAMSASGWNTTLAFINSLDVLPRKAEVTSGDWTNKYLP